MNQNLSVASDTTNIPNIENLFDTFEKYSIYSNYFSEPFKANSCTDVNYPHSQNCYRIDKNGIKLLNKKIDLTEIIECFYFIYVDYGLKEFDDKYWFAIGKIKNQNNIFFSYESNCSGTGFGLGETSTLYFSNDKSLLITYGLTNKQRNLIANNKKKFTIIENKNIN